MRKFCRSALVIVALLFLAHPVGAIVLGQIDDFEDGTRMGWSNGVQAALVNINTGGPAGANDNFLQVTADGSGQGGKLTTFNLQQWLGNYIAQGVNRIEIDLRNQGATSLSIRLAFKSQNLPNVPGYLSPAMILPVGSGWQHFSIAITQANLIAVGGPAVFNTFFSNGPGDARIINEVGTGNLNGDEITGQLGIDNIHAVPEPAVTTLLGGTFVSLASIALLRKRFAAR